MDVQGWICSRLGCWTFTVGRLGLEVHSCEIHSVGVEVHRLEVQVWIFTSLSSFLVVFSFAFLFCLTMCFNASWEMGFRRRFVESGKQIITWSTSSIGTGSAINQMSASTVNSGQGGQPNTRNRCRWQNSSQRSPQCAGEHNPQRQRPLPTKPTSKCWRRPSRSSARRVPKRKVCLQR